MKTVLFDTNVLLTDSTSLYLYPGAEIILPEIVLSELDKLKTARVDPDLRFRGREVSRQIFELAAGQSLVAGVEVGNGSTLRVIPFEFDLNALPEGFSTRSADEKILATAYFAAQNLDEEDEFLLVTNDLNMLLKAQSLEIAVEQFGNGSDVSFAKRYILRPANRWRVPLTILALTLAVFAAIIFIGLRMTATNSVASQVASTEFRNLLNAQQKEAYNNLTTLQQSPNDEVALQALGQYYSQRCEDNQLNGDRASVINDAKTGVRYYERYLGLRPTDLDARADGAKLYFYSGETDRAIQEVAQVLDVNPDHINANCLLGLFYWQGRQDNKAALDQFKKVEELARNKEAYHALYEQAKAIIVELEK